ncbi:hypothetical protein HY338_01235 [Candidatus Gottesmanbacteria bacterium]|nr:hypothetical protein [Candidatus Gottesmanbacteria bacterium]
MRSRFYLYLIIILILLSISNIAFHEVYAAQSGGQTKISATIPAKTSIKIFGYTSPDAIVQVTSVRVFGQTISDKTGYFEFNDVAISAEALEICLSTYDSDKRVGLPFCLSVPNIISRKEIGPLLLSPTLSLSSTKIWQNQKVHAEGKTIPNQQVEVSFFEISPKTLSQKISNYIVRLFNYHVLASDLPILSITSQRNGTFNFNLPTSRAIAYRVFVKAIFKDKPTLKSQTLTYSIGSSFSYFMTYILPWFILIMTLLILSTGTYVYDMKTHRVRKALGNVIEKRWKPFVIKINLRSRRLMYNFRDYWRSHRK